MKVKIFKHKNLVIIMLFLVVALGLFFISYVDNSNDNKNTYELIEKRTENSKTFVNPDGSYTLESYYGPIHYYDKKVGMWKDLSSVTSHPKLLTGLNTLGLISKSEASQLNVGTTYNGMGEILCYGNYSGNYWTLYWANCAGYPLTAVNNIDGGWGPHLTVSYIPPNYQNAGVRSGGSLERIYVPFDTRGIPTNSAVNWAKLSLERKNNWNVGGYYYYHVTSSWQADVNNLTRDDWWRTGDTSFGQFPYGSGWTDIWFNQSGLNYIRGNEGGWTKLAIKNQIDMYKTNNWAFNWQMISSTRGSWPILTINYTPQSPPSVTLKSVTPTCRRNPNANNGTGVGYADVTLNWTASNADYFQILRQNWDGNWEPSPVAVVSGNATSYTVTNQPQKKAMGYLMQAIKNLPNGNKLITYSDNGYAKWINTNYCNNKFYGQIVNDEAGDGPDATDPKININTSIFASEVGGSGNYASTSTIVKQDGTYYIGGLESGTYNIRAELFNPEYNFTGWWFRWPVPRFAGTPTSNTLINISNISFPDYSDNVVWFGVKKKAAPVTTFKVLMVGKEIQIKRDNLIINYDSNAVNNPPPGFKELLTPVWEETAP